MVEWWGMGAMGGLLPEGRLDWSWISLILTFIVYRMVYSVYILASANGVLYTGVTRDLERRIGEHRGGNGAGFTREHAVYRLVYFEGFGDVRSAIAREKQLKGWRREKKVWLIRRGNPGFGDLSGGYWVNLIELSGGGDQAEVPPLRGPTRSPE
jgi:putative endonuclease